MRTEASFATHRSAAAFFEEDFDLPPRSAAPPEPEIIEPVFSLAEVEAARADGWRDGRQAALAETAASSEASAREALSRIAASLTDAREEAAALAEAAAEAIALLVMDGFAAAFPALCARHGDGELRAIIRAILPSLHQEAKIVVRVAPHSSKATIDEIERLDPELVPSVQVVPTDAVAQGDIRIAWRNGGAVRDTAALWRDIAAILAPADLLSPYSVSKEVERAD